jgi:hypothetical protein
LPDTFQKVLVTVKMDIDFGDDHSYFCKFLEERLGKLSRRTSDNSRQARP